MRPTFIVLSIHLALFATQTAYAQEDSEGATAKELDTVTVIGTRSANKTSGVPATVNVVDRYTRPGRALRFAFSRSF